MKKKPVHKKQLNLEINQELNTLLKKYNIDKTKFIRPFSPEKFYNPDNVIEGNKNIESLICPICLNILKEPISCNSTKKSHSFCELCINKSLENSDKCPLCRQEFEGGINQKVEKLLQKLKFKCIYADEGCPKILDYSIYFKHIDKCGFRDLLYECQILKYNYSEKRYKKCKYIGTLKKINKHFLKCAFTEFKCPFCSKNIIQVNIKKHYKKECNILIKYYRNKEILYIGQHNDEYLEDGFGKLFFNGNGDGEIKTLSAEFHNGYVNGYGISQIGNESKEEGEWKEDLNGTFSNGIGIISNNNGVEYKGEFKNGVFNGIGTYYNEDGYFEAEFKEGNLDGYGIMYFNENNENTKVKFEGQFKNDCFHGHGIMYHKDGSIYNGYWKDGNKCGFGIETDITYNSYYIGQYKDGEYNGYGIKYYFSENNIFKGQVLNNKLEGYAFEYFENGDVYEGEWSKDKKNGFCFLHKSNGENFINIYEDDKLIFEKKL